VDSAPDNGVTNAARGLFPKVGIACCLAAHGMATASTCARTKIWCGAMSGTSADGIDVAFIELPSHTSSSIDEISQEAPIPTGDTATQPGFRLLHHSASPYSDDLKARILACRSPGAAVTLSEFTRLGDDIATAYAAAIAAAAREAGLDLTRDVAACGVHGQTLFHDPPRTLQHINGPLLAALLNCPVIADFRRADCAAGGQGAPLVPYADVALFRSRSVNRVLLNLGGIANITVLPALCPAAADGSSGDGAGEGTGSCERAGAAVAAAAWPETAEARSGAAGPADAGLAGVLAFDTGPANCISDDLCRLWRAHPQQPHAACGRLTRAATTPLAVPADRAAARRDTSPPHDRSSSSPPIASSSSTSSSCSCGCLPHADYDDGGAIALRGRVHEGILAAALAADPYFACPPPKSTDTPQMLAAWRRGVVLAAAAAASGDAAAVADAAADSVGEVAADAGAAGAAAVTTSRRAETETGAAASAAGVAAAAAARAAVAAQCSSSVGGRGASATPASLTPLTLRGVSLPDLLATACAFTAETVARGVAAGISASVARMRSAAAAASSAAAPPVVAAAPATAAAAVDRCDGVEACADAACADAGTVARHTPSCTDIGSESGSGCNCSSSSRSCGGDTAGIDTGSTTAVHPCAARARTCWEVVVSGGGASNACMMRELRQRLAAGADEGGVGSRPSEEGACLAAPSAGGAASPPGHASACAAHSPPACSAAPAQLRAAGAAILSVRPSSAALGMPEAAKEAVAFALLAAACAEGRPNNVPACTGASRPVVGGVIVPRPFPAGAPGLLPMLPVAAASAAGGGATLS